ADVDRHGDPGVADGVHPPAELVHVPAELGHYVVGAVVLLLLEEGYVGLDAAAGDVPLGRAGHAYGELVAELIAHEFHQLGGIVQVSAGAGPAERQVAAQGEDVVYAVVKIVAELLAHALARVAYAGEVRE